MFNFFSRLLKARNNWLKEPSTVPNTAVVFNPSLKR